MASNIFRSLAAAVSVCCATPALAQAPSGSAAEIAEIRAQIAALTQRLNDIERSSAAPVASAGATERPLELKSETPADRLVAGQTASAAPEVQVERVRELTPGPASRVLGALGAEAELLAASDASRVTFKLTREISETALGRQAEGWGISTRWSATASAPLSKGGPRTELWSQDGFASDFQFKLGLGRYHRPLRNPLLQPRLKELQAQALAACLKAKTEAECGKDHGDTFVATYVSAEAGKEYLRLAAPRKGGWAYGGEVSVGYLKHKYVDLASVTHASDTDAPWGAKVYFAPVARPAALLLFSLEHIQKQKDREEGVLCPASTGAPVTCLRGALGAPKGEQKLVWGAEFRRLFDIPAAEGATPLIRSIGIAPQVQHDSRNNVTTLDLPIYLVPNDKSEFIGGVRLGWDTEHHDVVAGVFVGRTFGLRP